MSEPTITAGQAVSYTKPTGAVRTAIVLDVGGSGLVDLLVLPNATTDTGVLPYTVQHVAYDTEGGVGTWQGVGSALDVQTALAAGLALHSRAVTIGHADLTDAVNGHAQVIDIGAALPASAVVLAHEISGVTGFAGGSVSACVLEVGGTDADAILDSLEMITDAPTAAELKTAVGLKPQGGYSEQQLTATFTPDGGHALLALTSGAVTITVWYVDTVTAAGIGAQDIGPFRVIDLEQDLTQAGMFYPDTSDYSDGGVYVPSRPGRIIGISASVWDTLADGSISIYAAVDETVGDEPLELTAGDDLIIFAEPIAFEAGQELYPLITTDSDMTPDGADSQAVSCWLAVQFD